MIVAAGEDRADGLAALHAEAFDHPWDAASLRGLLASPGVLALADAAFSAFILIRVAADEAEILTLAVSAATRRRGLGRLLVQASKAEAAARGAETLFLEVAADNEPAVALYRSAGFEPSGVRLGYYTRTDGPAVDALMLKTPLRPPA